MPVEDAATVSAIRRHEERLQRDPTSLAFAQLADLYRKGGRIREAIALCREGLARYPQYTTARLILAKALMLEGRPDDAIGELRAALAASPNEVECHRLAAEIERRQGRIEGVIAHLEAVVRLDPGDREARALLGLLRAEPRTDGEAEGLARVLADDTFVTVAFGRLCLEQGLAEEAAQVFTRILRTDPENPEARDGLEQALRARSRRRG